MKKNSRRDFLDYGARGALAAAISSGIAPKLLFGQQQGMLVNDRQSQLNETRVERIEYPSSTVDVVSILNAAARQSRFVSACGGRHAMGGQQFGTDTVL